MSVAVQNMKNPELPSQEWRAKRRMIAATTIDRPARYRFQAGAMSVFDCVWCRPRRNRNLRPDRIWPQRFVSATHPFMALLPIPKPVTSIGLLNGLFLPSTTCPASSLAVVCSGRWTLRHVLRRDELLHFVSPKTGIRCRNVMPTGVPAL
jgi:hypothetical protein